MRLFAALLGLAVGLLPALAAAQGILIDQNDRRFRLPRPIVRPVPIPQPRPVDTSYKIKELAVDANIADQIAKVQVSQTFVNTGSRQMEVQFIFPLPYDGAVESLTFMVEGKEYEARLLDRGEAREIYESYVRRYQDPALMEWIGTGMFQTSVFPVPAGAERKVTLRYSQLLRKQSGLTEWVFPLSTAKYSSQPVERLAFRVNIQSRAKIKNVYSPSHELDVKRPSGVQAVVTVEQRDEVPASDFRLLYDTGDKKLGASVISYRPESDEDGYFVLLVSPEIARESDQTPKKAVILAVDRSGSMSGKKIEQAREALKTVVNSLNPGDQFNVIAYDSTVESFRPEMQDFNDDNRKAALGFIEGIYAGGGTNIAGALKSALAQVQGNKLPTYVLFLSDGRPTIGETKEAAIVAKAKEENASKARIFTVGIGYDVNSRLLDKLGRQGYGQSEYIRPNEDIKESVGKLYARIDAPAMTGVEMTFDVEDLPVEQGQAVNRVFPREIYDVFAGDQLVVVGRYKKPGAAKVVVRGEVDGQELKFDFPAQLVEHSPDETYAFAAKLWAMRRIGSIIDEIDLHGKNQELLDELVTLSKDHGIITPYTSFLAEDDTAIRPTPAPGRPVPLAMRDRRNRLAAEALKQLDAADGEEAFNARKEKNELRAAKAAPAAAGRGYNGLPEKARQLVAERVLNVGAKTFYRSGARWIENGLSAEEIANAKSVKRFSDEYFKLITRHGKQNAKYLAIDDPVVIRLGKEVVAF